MLKILVTGANGFIGSKRAEALRQNSDFQIYGIDAEYFDEEKWWQRLSTTLELYDPEVIFHVGACSDTLSLDVQDMMIKNYESTKILVDWCRANDRKIIYSSSAANYGTNGVYPSNLYGWSKYVAEGYVTSNNGIALRYFNVFGPGEENKGKMASYYYQAYKTIEKKDVVYLFPGSPTRDFIFIDDVIRANLHAFQNYDSLRGKYYEVSTASSEKFETFISNLTDNFQYTTTDKIPQGYQFYTCGDKSLWMEGWNPIFDIHRSTKAYLDYLQQFFRREQ